nr:hypothetical protein [Tanacetum cinerariifolium]
MTINPSVTPRVSALDEVSKWSVEMEKQIVPLYYYLGRDIQIQFGREEFCLLTGLRFRVDYYDVYEVGLIPFRRRVFDSAKDGKPITGFEARHNVPEWILRLANDREDWDMYPGEEDDDDDHNSYSLMGFTWAFKNLMNRERRVARPSIKNKGRNANVTPFNLRNAFVDDNEVNDEVLITGIHDTDDYIVYENVDPNKVRRERYTKCMQFLYHSHPVYLDCHIMGYSVPELF